MNLLSTLAAFFAALGILIVAHEWGHYWVAKRCGVKVLRFSIGFGRPLWRRIGADGTEWVLAAIPFGGYVKMLDQRESRAEQVAIDPADVARAFDRQPVFKRVLIVCAGPAANFLLAILLYFGLNLYGIPEPVPVLGVPAAGTLARQAGLQGGERVLALNGEPVASFSELRWRLLKLATEGARARIEFRSPDGRIRDATLDFADQDTGALEDNFMARVGFELPQALPIVRRTMEGSAAREGGLRDGDRIVSIDGEPIATALRLTELVKRAPGRALAIVVERAGAQVGLSLVPRAETDPRSGATIGRLGVEFARVDTVRIAHGPIDSLGKAISQTADLSWFSLRMLGKMVVGEVSLKNLSGPVTIADYAGQSARLGFEYYVAFLALISISLGVLNLLPIPVLDGGHLLYYLVEIVRGSPPPERWLDVGQRAGLGILFVLMAIALFNDFARLLS